MGDYDLLDPRWTVSSHQQVLGPDSKEHMTWRRKSLLLPRYWTPGPSPLEAATPRSRGWGRAYLQELAIIERQCREDASTSVASP